jgi:hypothetical protein
MIYCVLADMIQGSSHIMENTVGMFSSTVSTKQFPGNNGIVTVLIVQQIHGNQFCVSVSTE